MAVALMQVVNNAGTATWPSIPAMGRTTRKQSELDFWLKSFAQHHLRGPHSFFWGRIPLNVLAHYFVEFCDTSPEKEFVDLCTPVHELGSGSKLA